MFLMQKATDVTADDLARAYAFGESERPLLRANMVSSIDGAATADGKSAGLASDGDHEIFHLQRAVADAIVVGAHTAVIENYGPPSVEDRYASARAERGQHPVPTLFLVSRSLNLPDDYATVADANVVIATSKAAPVDQRRRLVDAGATLVDCGETSVDPRLLVDALDSRGLRRILCEGGPRFLATLTAAGLLDELALTVAPTMIGGDAPRIAHGDEPHRTGPGGGLPFPMRMRHLIADDDGFQYQLWARVQNGSDTAD